jgi:putative FmdB family regulatory protein
MPLYEYECDACGRRFELIRKFSESDVDTCTQCGKGPVRRLMSSPAIQFKGTGWYITDYPKKSSASGDGKGSKPESSSGDSGTTSSSASSPSNTSTSGSSGSGGSTSGSGGSGSTPGS